MKMKGTLVLAAIALAAPVSVQAETTIDTTRPYIGSWQTFGVPNAATIGQTFTVGGDNVLNSFSLFLNDSISSPINFKAYIFAWNGTNATGSALYASSLLTFSGSSVAQPQEFAFNTGALALTTGLQYVAFFSTSGFQAGQPASIAAMPYAGVFGSDQLAGGGVVYSYNENDFAALTSAPWSLNNTNNGTSGDIWFKASFNEVTAAVPEPSTWALMLLGFAGLGFAAHRRSRTVSTAA